MRTLPELFERNRAWARRIVERLNAGRVALRFERVLEFSKGFSIGRPHIAAALIAEDLGIITDDVRAVMRAYGLPGMKILLFAFNEDLRKHPYLPHNYGTNCVVYTGTHDNNTVQGWFRSEATDQEKENFFAYIGKDVPAKEVHWAMIEIAMASKASLAIFPLQDVLGLGEEARFNKPASLSGNWQWRLKREEMTTTHAKRLKELTVHHKDHDHNNNPNDGSNWELLCLYCHDHEHEKYKIAGYSDGSVVEETKSSGFSAFDNLDSLLKLDKSESSSDKT